MITIMVILALGCGEFIRLSRDSDERSIVNPKNRKYYLYFEQSFQDTVTVSYQGKIIFRKYVSTLKKLAAAEEICKIDPLKNGQFILIEIGKKKYTIKPLSGYRYYYLTKFNDRIAATYSNVLRDYY